MTRAFAVARSSSLIPVFLNAVLGGGCASAARCGVLAHVNLDIHREVCPRIALAARGWGDALRRVVDGICRITKPQVAASSSTRRRFRALIAGAGATIQASRATSVLRTPQGCR